MNKKKVLLSVLALILVCALSVAGTMALLAENGGAVVNTFVAAGGPGPFVDENGFALKEHAYTQNNDGTYTEGAATTGVAENGYVVNEYKVLPGTTIPKKAFVELQRSNDAPAYLFLEVMSGLTTANADKDGKAVFTWAVESDHWEAVTDASGNQVTGNHGGLLYKYKTVLGKVENKATYNILDGDAIVVNANATAAEIGTTKVNMEFYAYLSQATVAGSDGTNTSDPATVYSICFPNP